MIVVLASPCIKPLVRRLHVETIRTGLGGRLAHVSDAKEDSRAGGGEGRREAGGVPALVPRLLEVKAEVGVMGTCQGGAGDGGEVPVRMQA